MNLTLKDFGRITAVILSLLLMPVGAWAQDFHWPEEVTTHSTYADVRHFTVTNNNGEVTVTGHCSVNTEMSFKLQTASDDASATYSSSNTAVADNNPNSSSKWDELIIKGAGTTTITATLSGNDTYTYTLVITEIDTDYNINICGWQVTSGNADNVLYNDDANNGKITYDAVNGELVLNNAQISYNQEYSIQFSVDNLNVRLIGENHIFDCFDHIGGGTGTVTFLSAGGEENCLVFDTSENANDVNNKFWGCTIANSLEDGSEWTIASKKFNTNYPQAYIYKQAATSYGLTIGEVQVTSANAADIMGDGKVSYDKETTTLTMNNVNYSPTDNTPFVTSSLPALTVKLMGSSSIYVGQDVTLTAAFVSTNEDAVLTFTTDEDNLLQPLNTNTVELASGFSSIVYTGYLYREQNMVKNLLAPSPAMEDDYLVVSPAGYEPDGTTFNYVIDYVDDALEDAEGTYNISSSAAENNITIAGPATVTVYAQYGEKKSAEKVGKLFGFETTQIKATYGTESVALPAIVPSIDESIEVYYNSDDETIASVSDGNILLGQIVGSTTLSANLQVPNIMPDYEILNTEGMVGEIAVTVVPTVPTIDLAEGTYNESQVATMTSNYESANFHYYRVIDDVVGNDSVTYDQTVSVYTTCTLHFYQTVNGQNSDEVVRTYTILPQTALDISFADNTREWASYCAPERDLETPDGLEAYVVTEIGQSEVAIEIIGYIPQGVGVLLKRTASVTEPLKAKAFLGQETTIDTNLLTGTTASTAVASLSGDVYVLYNGEFVKTKKGSIPANRAYLTLNSAVAPARLGITFVDNETTGIDASLGEASKAEFYDLQGRRVAQPVKGRLYIKRSAEERLQGKNGRKVIIK